MAVTVYELTGEQFGVVDDVMRATFADYEDLGRFMRMKLDIKLADIVEPSGLRKAAPDVIEDAEKMGYVPKLLATLWRESDSAKLKGVIDSFGICIDDYPAAAARELLGMEAVAANLVMRDVIVGYRPDIIKLCSLAARLNGLMYLHYTVDDVRAWVYEPLEAIMVRMPASAAKDLADIHRRLLRYQTDIKARFAEVKIADDNVSWIEGKLETAQQKLLFALRNWPAVPEIEDVVFQLSFVTSDYPAQLNAMMKETANSIGELDFHCKLAKLKTKTITITIADVRIVSDFVDDIDRLDAGIVIMGGRVAAHNHWQYVKNRLDDLNPFGGPTGDTRIFLDFLERRLGEVNKPPEDLAAARDAALAAFAAQDPQAMYYAVERLLAIIHNHFMFIGVKLLADATYVSQLGDGLQKVLEKLDT